MKTILAIMAVVGIWAVAVTFMLALLKAGNMQDPCVCTYYDDIDLDCEDCD
jgi:hypothetical protein